MTARERAEYLVGVINQYEPDPESDVPIGLWDKYRVDLIERALLDTIEECAKVVDNATCIQCCHEYGAPDSEFEKMDYRDVAAEIRKMGAH